MYFSRTQLHYTKVLLKKPNIIFIVQAAVPLTKLSTALVKGPSNSDHMGIRLTTGQVLHGNFFIKLKNRKQIESMHKFHASHIISFFFLHSAV